MQSNQEEITRLVADTRLAGRTALVTGSSSGIGEAIAHVLAASGATVIVHGRDRERTERVVTAIGARGWSAIPLVGDLGREPREVRALASQALDLVDGELGILVNNAGIYPSLPTAALPDDALEAVLALNVRAPHVLTGVIAPAMAERGRGVIINIGSWMARIGVPYGAAYTASKAALEQMTRTWAAEFGSRGLRVNSVAPGITLTPGNGEFEDMVRASAQGTPSGVPVRPVDVAYAVRWLVSDEAAFVNGIALDVDGGLLGVRK